jgi:DNA-binding NarL/FixJ family response regulator
MRIYLADHERDTLSALKLRLEQEEWLEVVGQATDAEHLLADVQSTQPDLLLVDWNLQGRRVSQLLPDLRRLLPTLLICALSVRPEDRSSVMQAGADDFVSKGDPPEVLMTTVRGRRRDPLRG